MADFLHLPLDPLNRAAPNTKLSSDLQHALPSRNCLPAAFALLSPALIRCRIMLRSNSAKAPVF
jgi:hypothetical protein